MEKDKDLLDGFLDLNKNIENLISSYKKNSNGYKEINESKNLVSPSLKEISDSLNKKRVNDNLYKGPKILEGFQKGGISKKSGNYIVGENGPEILNLPEGSSIIPLNVKDFIDGISKIPELSDVIRDNNISLYADPQNPSFLSASPGDNKNMISLNSLEKKYEDDLKNKDSIDGKYRDKELIESIKEQVGLLKQIKSTSEKKIKDYIEFFKDKKESITKDYDKKSQDDYTDLFNKIINYIPKNSLNSFLESKVGLLAAEILSDRKQKESYLENKENSLGDELKKYLDKRDYTRSDYGEISKKFDFADILKSEIKGFKNKDILENKNARVDSIANKLIGYPKNIKDLGDFNSEGERIKGLTKEFYNKEESKLIEKTENLILKQFVEKNKSDYPQGEKIKDFFQKGGIVKDSGNYMVGENGPEILTTPTTSEKNESYDPKIQSNLIKEVSSLSNLNKEILIDKEPSVFKKMNNLSENLKESYEISKKGNKINKDFIESSAPTILKKTNNLIEEIKESGDISKENNKINNQLISESAPNLIKNTSNLIEDIKKYGEISKENTKISKDLFSESSSNVLKNTKKEFDELNKSVNLTKEENLKNQEFESKNSPELIKKTGDLIDSINNTYVYEKGKDNSSYIISPSSSGLVVTTKNLIDNLNAPLSKESSLMDKNSPVIYEIKKTTTKLDDEKSQIGNSVNLKMEEFKKDLLDVLKENKKNLYPLGSSNSKIEESSIPVKYDSIKEGSPQNNAEPGMDKSKDLMEGIESVKSLLSRIANLLEGPLEVSPLEYPFRPDSRSV